MALGDLHATFSFTIPQEFFPTVPVDESPRPRVGVTRVVPSPVSARAVTVRPVEARSPCPPCDCDD